jgi:BirA family biotin operon repressor/biotin-[acetyl-CoA-carboxylase] ligase
MPGDVTVAGVATGVDAAGRLCVDTGATTVVVGAGDVVHLRPGS